MSGGATVDARRSGGSGLLEALGDELSKRLRARGDSLEVRQHQKWVAFSSVELRRVFAEVRSHRRDLEAFILPPSEELRNMNGLARSAPPTQGWGWFQSKFRLGDSEDLPAAVDLLLLSYEYRRRMGRGRMRGAD